jgi:MFS family permease
VGRRLFLLIYEIGLMIAMAAMVVDPAAWVLVLAAAVFGFGRGANGSSGPFAPAEQAWLAQSIPAARRGNIFSFNAGLQFWGMGIGSLLAAVLPHMIPGAKGAEAYMPLFLLNLLMAAINLIQILSIHEPAKEAVKPVERPSTASVQAESAVHKKENHALALLTVVNMVNALGIGLVAPLLPYWFNVKFGVGPTEIGPVYALTFFLTGISSLVIGRLSERIGLINSIVIPRVLGVGLLVAIPFMPSFAFAAVLYVIRSIVNRGSVGARQAFSMALVRDHRRGFASSLNAVSWSLPAALGPAIGGWFIGMGYLVWPFILAAGLQMGYVVLFPTIMGKYENKPTPPSSHASP